MRQTTSKVYPQTHMRDCNATGANVYPAYANTVRPSPSDHIRQHSSAPTRTANAAQAASHATNPHATTYIHRPDPHSERRRRHGQPTHMQETHMQVYSLSSSSRSDASKRARSSLDNFATFFVMTKMESHSSSPADTAAGVASEVDASALLDEASANQQRKVSGEEVIHVCLLQVTCYTLV